MTTTSPIQTMDQLNPRRVMIDREGRAIPYPEFKARYTDTLVGMLVRNDGWTLAFSAETFRSAYDSWTNEWVSIWLTAPKAKGKFVYMTINLFDRSMIP